MSSSEGLKVLHIIRKEPWFFWHFGAVIMKILPCVKYGIWSKLNPYPLVTFTNIWLQNKISLVPFKVRACFASRYAMSHFFQLKGIEEKGIIGVVELLTGPLFSQHVSHLFWVSALGDVQWISTLDLGSDLAKVWLILTGLTARSTSCNLDLIHPWPALLSFEKAGLM